MDGYDYAQLTGFYQATMVHVISLLDTGEVNAARNLLAGVLEGSGVEIFSIEEPEKE